jgi:hypothetical protein
MVQWQSLIKFEAECGAEYWASIPLETKPEPGLAVEGFLSIESLESDGKSKAVKVKKVGYLPTIHYIFNAAANFPGRM